MTTAYELWRKKAGANTQTNENPETDTVLTTATRVLKKNPNRYSLMLVNLSANDGSALNKNSVAATKGIKCVNGGGGVSLNILDDGMWVTDEWYCINETLQGTWYIVEEILIS